ncbi:AAA domain-containing protein [Lacibacter sp.]|uniref:AAA domain-containing protein n=1 Tax=Lacibacter sp. TaxID=1915409 RepID=UPI002B4B389C|nr:AAA domain-containing protein [Lacibacter sp.]HLP35500.1 AAA domain-containing protein [Lacibacter sp.]
MHPHIATLLKCIDLEEKEQANRYQLDQSHTLKQLKAEGLALHPIIVTRRTFGYADYPEISFKLSFPPEANMFRDGAAIECFISGEEPVKGVLLNLDGKNGEFRLFAPDFPDWIEDNGVGIKLAPDTRTTSIMKKTLQGLENNKPLYDLFEQLHQTSSTATSTIQQQTNNIQFRNKKLNESQQQAIANIVANDQLCIVHGPPGTGKTTTLIEAIVQLVQQGEKVLVSAPSNTAVDHLAKGLLQQGINLLRVGNTSKVDELIYKHTPEGKLNNSSALKEIKQLKIRAEEFRKMALKYKRSFGKAEREQRSLLFKEVKNIRTEIKKLQHYNEEKLFAEAQVIAGTPIGLYDADLKQTFHTLVIDEAGQCIEPLAWCIFPMAEKIVLAGDHWQLPPTVLSNEAAVLGFNRSVLEAAIEKTTAVSLLNIQYRMRKAIADFSSSYFYKDLLHTAEHLQNTGVHLTFIDTAGSGYNETHGPDGVSLQNEGELNIVRQLLEQEQLDPIHTAFISPYSGQVMAAKEQLPNGLRISTIDSFQGQEKENIIVSLVRSNDDGTIGFLKDYRRMNVAMTRAKEQLFVIGDSATIGADAFYGAFLSYVEQHGTYRTVWEFEIQI